MENIEYYSDLQKCQQIALVGMCPCCDENVLLHWTSLTDQPILETFKNKAKLIPHFKYYALCGCKFKNSYIFRQLRQTKEYQVGLIEEICNNKESLVLGEPLFRTTPNKESTKESKNEEIQPLGNPGTLIYQFTEDHLRNKIH